MDTYFIKPTDPTIRPRDPFTGARLHADGEEKPKSTYWNRQIREGAVEVAAAPKSARPKGDSE